MAIGALTEAAIAVVETAAQIEAATVAATGNTSEAAAAEDVLAEEAEGAAVAAAISVKAAGISPRQNMLRQVVRTVAAIAAIQTVARRTVAVAPTVVGWQYVVERSEQVVVGAGPNGLAVKRSTSNSHIPTSCASRPT